MTKETELQPPIIRAEKPDFLTSIRFNSFDLPEALVAGLTETGFTHCTPIQAQTLPLSLDGKDVAGQAQTGTGKTAAFLVTVFAKLIASPERKPELPSALIVAPTRELALQIFNEAEILCRHTGLRQALVIGGIDYQKQADKLRKGTDIVICTPGRIIDYLNQEIFKTSAIRIVVIDEADRVATDVASRGIHVDNITHVINYDLPQDAENYIHRIGRTARAGQSGRALSLACERYVLHLEPLEKMLGYKIPVVWPEDSLFFDDQCGPVIIEPKDARGKARVKRSGEAPKKSVPPKRSSAKNEKTPVGKRSRQSWKRPSNHFPGQFFGFKPPKTAADRAIPEPLTASDTNNHKASSDEKTNIPPKTKRRRRRRKKRTA